MLQRALPPAHGASFGRQRPESVTPDGQLRRLGSLARSGLVALLTITLCMASSATAHDEPLEDDHTSFTMEEFMAMQDFEPPSDVQYGTPVGEGGGAGMSSEPDGCIIASLPDTQFYFAKSACAFCTTNCTSFSDYISCDDDTDCSFWGASCVGPSIAPPQQTQFLIDNRLTWDPDYPIAFTTHVGDVVNHPPELDRWQMMHGMMNQMNGVIPWSVTVGNHDGYGYPRTFPRYLEYFNEAQYAAINQPLGAQFVETWGNPDKVNAAHLFQCGSKQVLNLSIRWDLDILPDSSVIERALEIIAEHPGVPVMVTTHAYLEWPGQSLDTQGYGQWAGTECGLYFWENLVKVAPEIFLVTSGHYSGAPGGFPDVHTRSRTDEVTGRTYVESMFNGQSVGQHPDLGNGWMMLFKVDWNTETIRYEAYSSLLNQTAAEAGFTGFSLENSDGTIGFHLVDPPGPLPSMGSFGLVVFGASIAGTSLIALRGRKRRDRQQD